MGNGPVANRPLYVLIWLETKTETSSKKKLFVLCQIVLLRTIPYPSRNNTTIKLPLRQVDRLALHKARRADAADRDRTETVQRPMRKPCYAIEDLDAGNSRGLAALVVWAKASFGADLRVHAERQS